MHFGNTLPDVSLQHRQAGSQEEPKEKLIGEIERLSRITWIEGGPVRGFIEHLVQEWFESFELLYRIMPNGHNEISSGAGRSTSIFIRANS